MIRRGLSRVPPSRPPAGERTRPTPQSRCATVVPACPSQCRRRSRVDPEVTCIVRSDGEPSRGLARRAPAAMLDLCADGNAQGRARRMRRFVLVRVVLHRWLAALSCSRYRCATGETRTTTARSCTTTVGAGGFATLGAARRSNTPAGYVGGFAGCRAVDRSPHGPGPARSFSRFPCHRIGQRPADAYHGGSLAGGIRHASTVRGRPIWWSPRWLSLPPRHPPSGSP